MTNEEYSDLSVIAWLNTQACRRQRYLPSLRHPISHPHLGIRIAAIFGLRMGPRRRKAALFRNPSEFTRKVIYYVVLIPQAAPYRGTRETAVRDRRAQVCSEIWCKLASSESWDNLSRLITSVKCCQNKPLKKAKYFWLLACAVAKLWRHQR